MLGDDQAEDRVAEELEALVGLGPLLLRAPAAVRRGPGAAGRVGEGVPQAVGQRLLPAEAVEVVVAGRARGRPPPDGVGDRLDQPAPSLATT